MWWGKALGIGFMCWLWLHCTLAVLGPAASELLKGKGLFKADSALPALGQAESQCRLLN